MSDPNFAPLADLSRLEAVLDRAFTTYGVSRKLPLYLTEYGYETNPPDPFRGVAPKRQSLYLNEAQYLAAQDPRVRSLAQFLLYDSAPNPAFAPRHPWLLEHLSNRPPVPERSSQARLQRLSPTDLRSPAGGRRRVLAARLGHAPPGSQRHSPARADPVAARARALPNADRRDHSGPERFPHGAGLATRLRRGEDCLDGARRPGLSQPGGRRTQSLGASAAAGPLVSRCRNSRAFEAPLAAPFFVLERSCTSGARRILRPRPASTSGTSRCSRTSESKH